MVEHAHKAFMERQSGTQYGSNENIILGQRYVDSTKRSGNSLRLVVQRLRQLVGHHLAHTLDVMPEQHAVLITLVAQLSHILVDGAVVF